MCGDSQLEALLKYRGNVRKGFVRDYKNAYSRKYMKFNGGKPVFERFDSIKGCDGQIVSMLNNKDVFWANSHMDQEIFEQIMTKAIAKKHGPQNNVQAKRGRKRNYEYCADSDIPSNKKRKVS